MPDDGWMDKANTEFAEASREAKGDPSYRVEGLAGGSAERPGERGVPLQEGEKFYYCPDCWAQFHQRVKCKERFPRTWQDFGGGNMHCYRGHQWGFDIKTNTIVDIQQKFDFE